MRTRGEVGVSKGADQQRLTPEERANLVAYLDGELNEAESRAIGTKLTQSVTARREIEVLQKTWELLEHLPRPRASESLTQRTLIEIQRLSTAGDDRAGKASKRVRKASTILLWGLVACGCFALGLILVRWVLPDPTARLARDLSIAENLDGYRAVGSIEFLERLDKSPEFANDPY